MSRCRGLFALLCVLASCDPGWVYTIPDARPIRDDGVRYSVDVTNGVRALFYASVFTVRGSSRVEVVNDSDEPIHFDGSPTVIVEAEGKVVPGTRCDASPTTTSTILKKGDTANVRCGFQVNFGENAWYCCNDDFRMITLWQPGFSRAGRALVVRATMKWSR